MRELLRRAWYAIRQRRFEADLREELEFHRSSIEHDLREQGTEPTEARFAAKRALGSVALAQDQARDVWTPRWLQGIGQDVRLAFRTLRTTPVVSTVVVLSLALGIGANTAIFSLVNSLLLRTLPVTDPNRLALVTVPMPNSQAWSYPVWDQIRMRPELFDKVAAWSSTQFNLASSGETQFVDGVWASGSFFDTLGVPALVGRPLSDADDQRGGGPAGAVAVIGYGFWQRHFGGAPDVVGHALTIEGVPFTIVGVTPQGFFGADVGRTFDVVLPLGAGSLLKLARTTLNSATVSWLKIIARLKPGQTTDMAGAALRSVQPQIRTATLPATGSQRFRDQYLKAPFGLTAAATGNSALRNKYERSLLTIMAVVALVLLIACANIANLLLARATARRHELSVRRALGASRWRLVRQFLAESVLLATIGAAVGLLIASWASRALVHQLTGQQATSAVFLDLSLDGHVLMFTVGVAVFTAILFGTAPAAWASDVTPMESLKERDQGASTGVSGLSLASGLVVAQVALSVVLVVAAGLLVRTFVSLTTRHPGFDADRILVVSIDASHAVVDRAARFQLFAQVRDVVKTLPGVADAAISVVTPVSGADIGDRVELPGAVALPDNEHTAFENDVSPGWFRTYGTPLIAGRDFTDDDQPGTLPVALVNRAFATKFLNGASPIGRTFTRGEGGPNDGPIEIVGLVADAVYRSLRDPVPATVYRPGAQATDVPSTFGTMSLTVRSAGGSPGLLTRTVAAAAKDVNPDLRLTFRSLDDQVSSSLSQERLIAMLSGFFGGLALVLAGVGLYGVTAYAVSRRRREIGIRMALGSAPAGVVRLVLTRVAILLGIGVVIGAAVSAWASRFLATLLYGLEPRDPATLVGAAVVLTAVAALAGWIPAWRASRIDPASVLRNE